MEWLTPENPSERGAEDPTGSVPSGPSPADPTGPIPPPPDGGGGPGSSSPPQPVGPFPLSGQPQAVDPTDPRADPTGPIPVVGGGEVPSAGGPPWLPPPVGGGGAVPPWGWPSSSWPGGASGEPPTPPRRRRVGLVTAAVLLALLLLGGGLGAGLTLAFARTSPTHAASAGSPASGAKGNQINASAIASQVDPGVVDIIAQDAYQQAESEGTGMVLTPKGEVLTNNHVVEGSSTIRVKPVDGQKSYAATVIGVDPTADVALLQMHGASGLATVPVGNSSKVSVGDSVVAIGNALGLGGKPTVTEGAITALNRSVTASDQNGANTENLTGMLQTSAQLASGDSGGPLADAAGKVIGMDTAAPGGQSSEQASGTQSIGWAIPINKAMSVVDQIRSNSSDPNILIGPRPFIGVDVQDASQAAQGANSGFPGVGGGPFNSTPAPAVDSGAYVTQVVPGSPAESAGIQAGDVIVSFDGKTITGEKELSNDEAPLRPGDSASIGWVDQSGQQHSATITLATGPAA